MYGSSVTLSNDFKKIFFVFGEWTLASQKRLAASRSAVSASNSKGAVWPFSEKGRHVRVPVMRGTARKRSGLTQKQIFNATVIRGAANNLITSLDEGSSGALVNTINHARPLWLQKAICHLLVTCVSLVAANYAEFKQSIKMREPWNLHDFKVLRLLKSYVTM